jgi:hypothetical protein
MLGSASPLPAPLTKTPQKTRKADGIKRFVL